MKNNFPAILVCLLVCLFIMPPTPVASSGSQDLTIIYSNDVREEIEPCG